MAIMRTHRPVWSSAACLGCGSCTRRCPTSLFLEQEWETDSLRGQVAREARFPVGAAKLAVPPCQAACPLGQDVPGYVRALAASDFDKAQQIILETNPFPALCGRLCVRACMHACVRGALDRFVDIRALKRAACELAPTTKMSPAIERKERVAVVGAGPAGLAAAYFLRRDGFLVSVLEAADHAGGLLRRAVPVFDLPQAVLDKEIEHILSTGIELRTRWRLGSPSDLERLFGEGFAAVVLATGSGLGQPLNIDGEKLTGCTNVVAFAARCRRPNAAPLNGPAVIAGAGYPAIAAARLAIRAGASPVTLVMKRGLADGSIDPDLLRLAKAEGVQVLTECWPIAIVGEGEVRAVRCAPVLFGAPDRTGRRWPISRADSQTGATEEVLAKLFVAAEDRKPSLGWLASEGLLRLGPLGTLWVESKTQMTGRRGVFAAGEVMTGPRNVIESIATAKKVAASVRRFIEGGEP